MEEHSPNSTEITRSTPGLKEKIGGCRARLGILPTHLRARCDFIANISRSGAERLHVGPGSVKKDRLMEFLGGDDSINGIFQSLQKVMKERNMESPAVQQ